MVSFSSSSNKNNKTARLPFLFTSLQFESNPLNTKHTLSTHPSILLSFPSLCFSLLTHSSIIFIITPLSLHSLSQTHIITNYKWIFSSKLFSTLVFHQLCYIDDYDVLLYTVSQTNKDFIRRTPQ